MPLPEQLPIPGYEPVRLPGINPGTLYLAPDSSSGTLVVLSVFRREVRLVERRRPNWTGRRSAGRTRYSRAAGGCACVLPASGGCTGWYRYENLAENRASRLLSMDQT